MWILKHLSRFYRQQVIGVKLYGTASTWVAFKAFLNFSFLFKPPRQTPPPLSLPLLLVPVYYIDPYLSDSVFCAGLKISVGHLGSLVLLRTFTCLEIITLGEHDLTFWTYFNIDFHPSSSAFEWNEITTSSPYFISHCAMVGLWFLLYCFIGIGCVYWKCWRHQPSNKSTFKMSKFTWRLEGSCVWTHWRSPSLEEFQPTLILWCCKVSSHVIAFNCLLNVLPCLIWYQV